MASHFDPTRSDPAFDHDAIAHRAYMLWEKWGRPQGQDVAIWLAAEQALRGTDINEDEEEDPRDVDDDTAIEFEDRPRRGRSRGPLGDGKLPPPHFRR